jgi:hypothetical protein
MNKRLRKVARAHQKELTELLGRLEDKYRVSFTIPPYEMEYLPYSITLSTGKAEVDLSDWGSGTRSRTLILLTLFRAREISKSRSSASKITPIIVIEEPESFLHPSAQAEFGRVIQDLSEEFRVQVVTTTHSPYMLSIDKPESNILLARRLYWNQLKETYRVDTVGPTWMEPFGLALGVDNKEFEPWKNLFFAKSDSILLVEGDIDVEYFELLRDSCHGAQQLDCSGEIFPYGGRDTLKQAVLLKFIKDKYKNIFITFDLDAEADVEKCLISLGFEKGRHYWPLGYNEPGMRRIEGLLPQGTLSKVFSENPKLAQAMDETDKEARKSARNKLKRLLLDEFKIQARPGTEDFAGFYKVTKIINNALR